MTVLPLVLEGTERFAFDVVHHQIVNRLPRVSPVAPVVEHYAGDCDLVLIAVPAGKGAQVAAYLADGFGTTKDPA